MPIYDINAWLDDSTVYVRPARKAEIAQLPPGVPETFVICDANGNRVPGSGFWETAACAHDHAKAHARTIVALH